MTGHPSPTQLVATCPEDLLAFVPVAIGFPPESSVAMLTFGSPNAFHARVDLPDDTDDVDNLVECLLAPARKHAVAQVVFVVYDDDTAVADETAWSLHEAFTDAGISVIDVLRVHDGRWFAILPGRAPSTYAGVPFDTTAHPFAAQAVYDGRVTHTSREALRASLDPDPAGVALVEAEVAHARALTGAAVRTLLRRHASAGTTCSPAELARLGASLTHPELRDEAWCWLDRPQARAHVDLWTDAVRRIPERLVPGPAAVLAFAAWLAGEGALSWCAIDRCRAVAPEHSLARLVAGMLESATSPELWEQVDPTRGHAADGAA